MNLLDGVKQLFRMCGHAFTITVHERLDKIESELQAAKLMETDAALLQASIHIIENLHALAGRTVVDNSNSLTLPEAALIEFLYSHVPARAAIEVKGCNGEIGEALLRAGYEVYALEEDRTGGNAIPSRRNGHGAGVATETLVASLATHQGTISQAIGLITLGRNPLPAVRELGDRGASVIAGDLTADFAELVPEMRSREYHWHVVLYRKPSIAENTGTSYLSNHLTVLPDWRGSAFFFRDYRVFAEAQAWCASTLPRTYFKPQQV